MLDQMDSLWVHHHSCDNLFIFICSFLFGFFHNIMFTSKWTYLVWFVVFLVVTVKITVFWHINSWGVVSSYHWPLWCGTTEFCGITSHKTVIFGDLFRWHKAEQCTIWWVMVQIQELFHLKQIPSLMGAEQSHVMKIFIDFTHVM